MLANVLYQSSVFDRGRRLFDALLPRLIVVLAVIGIHAIFLMVVRAADVAQVSIAATAIPQPWACLSSAPGRHVQPARVHAAIQPSR